MNKIYTDEYINNFLKEYESIHIEDNIIIAKIKKIYEKLKVYINIQKLELIIANENVEKKCDFYIQNIYSEISHTNNLFNYKFSIFDICGNNNISIFKMKQKLSEPMIRFQKELSNININFSFQNIELQEDDFIYLLSFIYSIDIPPRCTNFGTPSLRSNLYLLKYRFPLKNSQKIKILSLIFL